MSEQDETGRPRREASKVTDFKQFHLTGGSQTPQGKVAAAVKRIETPQKTGTTDQASDHRDLQGEVIQELPSPAIMSDIEQLKAKLEKQKAKFNKKESEESRCEQCNEDCKQHKKSGMLDKATTSIQHKQIWPQKNLSEDWADEEMEFKHMQFDHLVAGETRTIEMGTDPAQILGRLRLLRRMAYAKLRGYEWPLIRKMYAAILRSIEANENTWEANFDRFESILYRKTPLRREEKERGGASPSNKKWFCRDWNKGNCNKTAPHKAWFGSGTNAVSRTVLHICATCYMKDRTQKDHPETHESCPHKEA